MQRYVRHDTPATYQKRIDAYWNKFDEATDRGLRVIQLEQQLTEERQERNKLRKRISAL